MRSRAHGLAVWCLVSLAACVFAEAHPAGQVLKIAPDVKARRTQFVQGTLDADTSSLSAPDLKALDRLVNAARIVDQIFLRQAWVGNPTFAPRVAALTGPDAQAVKDYYRIMAGPWDRLKEFEPFLGTLPRPPGAGFYPEDMSKEEFERHLAANPGEKGAFTSTTTVIRRDGVKLVAVPYSKEYRDLLKEAASELRAAASAPKNESLKKFLKLRADAFLSAG